MSFFFQTPGVWLPVCVFLLVFGRSPQLGLSLFLFLSLSSAWSSVSEAYRYIDNDDFVMVLVLYDIHRFSCSPLFSLSPPLTHDRQVMLSMHGMTPQAIQAMPLTSTPSLRKPQKNTSLFFEVEYMACRPLSSSTIVWATLFFGRFSRRRFPVTTATNNKKTPCEIFCSSTFLPPSFVCVWVGGHCYSFNSVVVVVFVLVSCRAVPVASISDLDPNSDPIDTAMPPTLGLPMGNASDLIFYQIRTSNVASKSCPRIKHS